MKKIDLRIIRAAALVFIVILGYGIMRYLISLKKLPVNKPGLEIVRHVKAQPIKYDNVLSEVKAPGRLKSVSQVAIVAEASGKILAGSVPLKKGAGFKKGDVLFTIYPDEAKLALKASKSQFLNTLANLLPDISIDFSTYEKIFTDFFNSIKLEDDLPDFPLVEDEKLKIFLSNRNVLSEYFKIKKDELQLKRHSVYAPFTGTFTNVFLETGSYTNTGGVVANAIQTNELELEVPLERFDAEWVKLGDRVKVYSEKRNLFWNGVVVRKNKFVDEDTQSQIVFIRIKNNNGHAILSGEYLLAIFPGHPIENAMELPRNAVFNSNQVYIIKNGRLQTEEINIIKTGEKVLVFNGLAEGDTIVIQPLIGVREGIPVVIANDKKPDSLQK